MDRRTRPPERRPHTSPHTGRLGPSLACPPGLTNKITHYRVSEDLGSREKQPPPELLGEQTQQGDSQRCPRTREERLLGAETLSSNPKSNREHEVYGHSPTGRSDCNTHNYKKQKSQRNEQTVRTDIHTQETREEKTRQKKKL